jgi:NitT/TauT family transport system substrate-binding protein
MPMYVALYRNYFADEGVDLKIVLVPSPAAGVSAVLSGDGHYYMTTPATAARAVAQGGDVRIFAGLMMQFASDIVVSRTVADRLKLTAETPLSQRIAALRGLNLGIHSPGSVPDLLFRFIARQEKWNPDQAFKLLPLGTEGLLPGLQQGRIDGFAFASPLTEMAVVQQNAFLLINTQAGEYPPLNGFFSIAAVGNGQWLQKSPDAARAVVKALWRGARTLHKEPEQAKAAVRKQFANLPQPLFDRAFAINAKAFRDNPDFTRAQIEQNIELQGAVTGQPIKVDVERIYTRSIIEAVAPSMR